MDNVPNCTVGAEPSGANEENSEIPSLRPDCRFLCYHQKFLLACTIFLSVTNTEYQSFLVGAGSVWTN